MRDVYRNPMFYYLVVPVLVAAWPLLVWAVYLPQAQEDLEAEQDAYLQGQTYIVDILQMDPDRLEFAASEEVSGEFEYGRAITRVANLCGIQPTSVEYSAGKPITSRDKKRQNARVALKDVSIVQAAKFLSTLQSMWVHLSCEKIKLAATQGLPDIWEVDLDFWYYY